MTRLKFSVLALLAVAASFAAMSASAFAITLPEYTVATNAKAAEQSVTSTFENEGFLQGTIVSPKLEASLMATSKSEGTFKDTFKESKCKTLLGEASAESTGQSAGVIVVEGTYKIVGNTAKKVNEALQVLKEVDISCLLSSPLEITVKGDVLGTLTPEKTKGTSFAIKVKASKGAQEVTEYEEDSGTKVKTGLETTVLGSSTASTQNESTTVAITTEKETELT
jgi:hypothetical protein